MFQRFARRLTIWYVGGTMALVGIIAATCAFLALFLYVHLLQENIDADERAAEGYAVRAAQRGQPFISAAVEFEQRMSRPGVRVIAAGPFPHREFESKTPLVIRPESKHDERFRPGSKPPPLPPPPEHPPTLVVDGQIIPGGDARTAKFGGSRLGFAIATAFGGRIVHIPFLDGDLSLLPDPNAIGRLALWLLAGVVGVAVVTGILAGFAGRYITTQVLRPLVDVTHALQRFAARDFTPQPIAVAGKSDFDAIALAYNAAAAQVAAAFAERQQTETQMRQFVADAGHELRTPLTIVLGYIDLLRRKADAGDERSRRIFKSIALEGARMRTLIDNLVLLARMEAEDVRPTEPFELEPLLEDVVDARKVLVPTLRIELDVAVEATVIGNRDEIYEAVANIVDNAIKYAPESPIRIAAQAVSGGIEVTVSDRGPGIHPDDRDAIFDRFYRGATRGEVEGSGLGLAIAKRAIERAGGTLALAATSTDGTTFALRLRADKVRARQTAIAPES